MPAAGKVRREEAAQPAWFFNGSKIFSAHAAIAIQLA
jgi:hypothetical protein